MSRKAAAAALVVDPDKAAQVEKERARLMALFDGADENKLKFIRDHVQQLAWLGITILELQADVDARGPVVPFQNGREQTGLQANPACKILKDYQQLYNAAFRALLPVVQDKPRTKELVSLKWDLVYPEPQTPEEIEAEERAEEEKRKRIDAEIAAAQKQLDEMHAKFGK